MDDFIEKLNNYGYEIECGVDGYIMPTSDRMNWQLDQYTNLEKEHPELAFWCLDEIKKLRFRFKLSTIKYGYAIDCVEVDCPTENEDAVPGKSYFHKRAEYDTITLSCMNVLLAILKIHDCPSSHIGA